MTQRPAQHLCGLQGFNPMLGDTCPVCDAAEELRRSEEEIGTQDPVAILGFRADELKRIRALHSPHGAVPMPGLANDLGRIESAVRHAMALLASPRPLLAEAIDLIRVGMDAGWDRGDLATAEDIVQRFARLSGISGTEAPDVRSEVSERATNIVEGLPRYGVWCDDICRVASGEYLKRSEVLEAFAAPLVTESTENNSPNGE